ncbi:MAG TPA: hypothetical protein VMO78_03690 [Rhizomicrobium sp.]|nr:hypothetical protein [Rhizomicrobium sp.]
MDDESINSGSFINETMRLMHQTGKKNIRHLAPIRLADPECSIRQPPTNGKHVGPANRWLAPILPVHYRAETQANA